VAEESDLERTEPASQRRLEQAREQGQVPQSRELSAFLVLIAGSVGVWVMGSWVAARAVTLMRNGLTLERSAAFDPKAMAASLWSLGADALLTLAPLLLVLVVAALAGPLAMGGFIFSPKAIQPDFNRLDPLKGFSRMVSVQGLAELVKALLKALLIGGVALWVVSHERDTLFALFGQSLHASMSSFSQLVVFSAVMIIGGMALVAAIDVPFQLWQYHSKLKMTKEELRQEAKELEGDPQLKARIRSQQREMARKRMMSEVPKADVVVTNPTHFSVALKYDASRMRAPRVVAKGAGLVAQRIREIAGEHSVPLLEAPPLARALYRHTEPGDEVPSTLYTAVAEVMAYVYQLNHYFAHGGLPPQPPSHISVPEGMDPGPSP
jgi:flagellar biosynthetic protein FlhB